MNRRSDSTSKGTESRRSRRGLTRWQAEFPYHWDADDLVSRRELLRFTVMASGALFAATAGVVALSYLNPLRTVRKQAIAQMADIPPGSVHYFQYPTTEDEAILLKSRIAELEAVNADLREKAKHISLNAPPLSPSVGDRVGIISTEALPA